MMKLQLEEIAPFLPYGLKMRFENATGREIILKGITNQGDFGITITDGTTAMWLEHCGFKPVLRPLSDLANEVEINGAKFIPINWLDLRYSGLDYGDKCEILIKEPRWINQSDYMLIQHLIEWHFDVFGLIESDMAISIHDLTPTKQID